MASLVCFFSLLNFFVLSSFGRPLETLHIDLRNPNPSDVPAQIIFEEALDGSLPLGLATYFASLTCPDGFIEIPSAKGRLVVSVTDPSVAGLTLYDALADREDRGHSHPYTVETTINEQNVAAIDCCNDDSAQHGSYSSSGSTDSGTSGLPFTQLILCAVANASLPYRVPYGTVAYFAPGTSACPTNWTAFSDSTGRILVPGYDESDPLPSLSPPLQSLEDRTHNHTVSSSFATNPVSFAGVDGCCNDSPSADGTYPLSGTASDASTGLPYIQLLTCINTAPSFETTVPEGTYLFSAAVGCPPNWSIVSTVSGRFLIVLPENGTPGESFGGDSISQDNTPPGHSHNFNGTISLPSCGVGLASGCCAGGYGGAGDYAFTGASSSDYADLPYLLVSLCQKD